MLWPDTSRYFAGLQAYAGYNKAKRDYSRNWVQDYFFSNAVYALERTAFESADSTVYKSPIDEGCQQNFIIYISNGPPDASDVTGVPTQLLTTAGGDTTTIPISPDGYQSVVSDEWARFLANSDINASVSGKQSVFTYTLDVNPPVSRAGDSNTALLKSMAKQGKGSYFAVSSENGGEQVAKALLNIFSEIQSVDSAFASASLPVSVTLAPMTARRDWRPSLRYEYEDHDYDALVTGTAFRMRRHGVGLALHAHAAGVNVQLDAAQDWFDMPSGATWETQVWFRRHNPWLDESTADSPRFVLLGVDRAALARVELARTLWAAHRFTGSLRCTYASPGFDRAPRAVETMLRFGIDLVGALRLRTHSRFSTYRRFTTTAPLPNRRMPSWLPSRLKFQ